MSTQALYDLVIIGGGINGCGIARDAAGRESRGRREREAAREDLETNREMSFQETLEGD